MKTMTFEADVMVSLTQYAGLGSSDDHGSREAPWLDSDSVAQNKMNKNASASGAGGSSGSGSDSGSTSPDPPTFIPHVFLFFFSSHVFYTLLQQCLNCLLFNV